MQTALLFALALTSSPQGGGASTSLAIDGDVFFPMNDGFGRDRNIGFGFSLGLWAEWEYVVLKPEWSFHYGPGDRGAHYINLAWDLGVFAMPIRGSVTPILGGGIGLRYLDATEQTQETVIGSVLSATFEEQPSRSDVGFALFGRVGVLFFRDSPTHLTVSGDYTAAFMDGTPQSFIISLGLTT